MAHRDELAPDHVPQALSTMGWENLLTLGGTQEKVGAGGVSSVWDMQGEGQGAE